MKTQAGCRLSSLKTQLNAVRRRNACKVLGIQSTKDVRRCVLGLCGSALFCYTEKTPRIISGAYIFNSSAVLTVLTVLIIIVIRVVRIILISLLGIGILILIRRLLITLLRISILIGSAVLLIGSTVLIVTLLIGRLILRIRRFCGIRIEAVTAQIETCVNELVKVVLHEDIINDSKAENADNKINNRIIVMLDTFFMQTVAQFLLRKIKSHKREENDEQNLQLNLP